MIALPNGCRCSEIQVSPKNWRVTKKVTPWRIHYRFYDPANTDPKTGKIIPHQVKFNAQINRLRDLAERREMARRIIEEEYKMLKERSYNPITGGMIEPELIDYEIHPDLPLIKALDAARDHLTCVTPMKRDIKSALKTMAKAAALLRYEQLPVNKCSRRHIIRLLDQCGKINPNWSPRRYNMYRSYLLMLFNILIQLETVDAEPVSKIKKQQEIKTVREVLNAEERRRVREHLRKNAPEYFAFVNLFFHSGGRKTELLQQTTETVDLKKQKYKAVVKKGRKFVEVKRTIKDVAMPYWQYFLREAKKGQYLFGVGFKPATEPMRPDTPTRWWQRLVKDKKTGLGINVNFYALKHLHTSEVVGMIGTEDEGTKIAAEHNAHKSTAMVRNIYDVFREDREHNKLKRLGNEF